MDGFGIFSPPLVVEPQTCVAICAIVASRKGAVKQNGSAIKCVVHYQLQTISSLHPLQGANELQFCYIRFVNLSIYLKVSIPSKKKFSQAYSRFRTWQGRPHPPPPSWSLHTRLAKITATTTTEWPEGACNVQLLCRSPSTQNKPINIFGEDTEMHASVLMKCKKATSYLSVVCYGRPLEPSLKFF